MKKIQMMGGADIIISNEDAEKIIESADKVKFISLKSGEFINTSSISCITNYTGIEVFEGSEVFEQENGLKYIITRKWGEEKREKRFLTTDDEVKIERRTPEEKIAHLKEKKEQLLLQAEKEDKEQLERIKKTVEKYAEV